MHILYVLHSFSPTENRGAEIVALREMKEAISQGNKASLFYRKYQAEKELYQIEELAYHGISTYAINADYPCDKGLQSRYLNIEIEKEFLKLLTKLSPDKVVFHHLLGLSMNLPLIVKEKRILSSFVIHDSWGLCDQIQMLNRDLTVCKKVNWVKCVLCRAPQFQLHKARQKLETLKKFEQWAYQPFLHYPLRWMHRLCAYFVAFGHPNLKDEILNRMELFKKVLHAVDTCYVPSHHLRNLLIEHGVDESKLIFKKNISLKLPEFRQRQPAHEIFTLGFVGSLIPAKGIHVLLRAMKKLKNFPLKLIVYGSFHEFEEFPGYTQMIKKSFNDSRIDFAGSFAAEDIHKVYSSFDCLVVPSICKENAPLVIAEAQMFGLAVIASDFGGMREMLQSDPKSLLFKPRSPLELSRAIKKMMYKAKKND